MSRASEAYAALSLAMISTEPECSGLELFTADSPTADDKAVMGPICNSCPLFALCRVYGDLERPKAGYWAGKTYSTYNTKGSR